MLKFDKMKPIRDPKYLAFIRTLPCCACKTTLNIVVHHFGRRGISIKAGDDKTVPLCWNCHKIVHDRGRKEFEWGWSINFKEIADALYELYKGKAGK